MGDNGLTSPTQQDAVIAAVHRTRMAYTREHYEHFFRSADKDKDGFLTIKEMREYLKLCDYNGTESDIRRMFKSADTDVDDKISYNEYLIAMGQKPEDDYQHVSLLRRVFALFDRDGSGEIDKKELKHIFAELGRHMREEDVQRVMELADKDGSGTLNYEEFIEAVIKSDAVGVSSKKKKSKK